MYGPSGGRVHMNPDSSVQVAEQPSPDRLLPSSHASPERTMPSPHWPVQAPAVPPIGHLGSGTQVAEQPSYGFVLPSSQPSDPSFFPSPHFVWWHSLTGLPVQAQPGFQRQFAEQAFFSTVIPGSHGSLPVRM